MRRSITRQQLVLWRIVLCAPIALLTSCADADSESGEGEDLGPDFRAGETGALSQQSLVSGDFDNDGNTDIVWLAPAYNSARGRIYVWYAPSSPWFPGEYDVAIDRDSTGMDDAATAGDYFGASGAAGDFNNDGYDDIAIGVPGDDPTVSNSGSIHIIYGGASGLSATNSPTDKIIHQDTTGVPDTCESSDNFGEQLVSGDFNCDGYDDVAVGAPAEDIGAVANAGSIWTISGSSTGLSASTTLQWYQGNGGIGETAEANDECGSALAAGNFNGDTYSSQECVDLAWGCPGEDISSVSDAGAVQVVYSGTVGGVHTLASTGTQVWHQDVTNIEGTPDTSDEFGSIINAGDDDADGYDDLLIKVDEGCSEDAQKLYGSSSGITSANDVLSCTDPSTVGEMCASGCSHAVGAEVCTCTGTAFECLKWFVWNMGDPNNSCKLGYDYNECWKPDPDAC